MQIIFLMYHLVNQMSVKKFPSKFPNAKGDFRYFVLADRQSNGQRYSANYHMTKAANPHNHEIITREYLPFLLEKLLERLIDYPNSSWLFFWRLINRLIWFVSVSLSGFSLKRLKTICLSHSICLVISMAKSLSDILSSQDVVAQQSAGHKGWSGTRPLPEHPQVYSSLIVLWQTQFFLLWQGSFPLGMNGQVKILILVSFSFNSLPKIF